MEYDNGSHGGDWGHGPSFGDLFVGLELAAGLTGHSLSIANAAAIAAIASEVAQTHGGPAEFHGYQTGYVYEAPALAGSGWHAPEDGLPLGSSAGRQLDLPGIARDATTVGVLSWPHGKSKPGLKGPQKQIRRLAEQANMVSFASPDINIGGVVEINRTEDRILSIGPSRVSDKRQVLPNGWFRGASGRTHLWREFFRFRPSRFENLVAALLKRFRIDVTFLRRADTFENRRTFLIVTGSTWYYEQTADYETRVAFSVYSLPFVQGNKWTYRWDQIKVYRVRAERLAQCLKDYLQKHPAPPAAIEQRRRMGPEATEPDASA